MTLEHRLAVCRERVDPALERFLPADGEVPTRLVAAMRHALRGGKRLRPFLCMESARAFGLRPETVLPTACGLEMLHCATLVHDDMPCVDDSDLRHGRAACHVEFDEATALLAGDALIIGAFECLTRQAEEPDIEPERVLRCVRELAEYTGVRGLVVGEALDIEAEGRPCTESELEFIHLNKTAKLIICSARSGAILAGAPADQLTRLTDYAEALGLLFQITDDLLDADGDTASTGKPVGADAAAGKATYPALLGLAAARERADHFGARALQSTEGLPNREVWEALVEFVVRRRH